MSSPLASTLDWRVVAASASSDASSLGAPALPSYGGLLLKTVVALLIVLILAWVLLRWGLPRLLPGGRTTGPLRIVARQPLDARRSVVVLESYGRFFLLGVADGSITLLTEVPADAVARADLPAAPPGRRFADVLRTVLGRPAAGSDPAPGPGPDPAAPGPGPQDRG
jgi:flagellar biosynthetic protein FliO